MKPALRRALLVGCLGAGGLVFVCFAFALLGAFWGDLDRWWNQVPFDQQVWLASRGDEWRSPRGTMIHDLDRWVADEPSREEVYERLGPPTYEMDEPGWMIGRWGGVLVMNGLAYHITFVDGRAVSTSLIDH